MYEETKTTEASTDSEDLAKVHQESLRHFDRVQEAQREERKQCLEDRRFYSVSGAQWEGPLAEQFENKPKFEVNKVHLAVLRIINEYRNNRVSATFVPKAGETGPEYDTLADTCADLFRADEQDSCAEEAYDNAFEEAAGGGYGAIRLCAEVEDADDAEEGEDAKQRIRIKPIFDADSCVFFDLNAKRQDKSDAKRCWVLTAYDRDTYKAEFGDDPESWPKDVTFTHFDWATPDVVFVAEYYYVVVDKVQVQEWSNRVTNEKDRIDAKDVEDDPALYERLVATGWTLDRTKTIKRRSVRKLLMSGGGVLEDLGRIAGRYIPVIPVYGKRWFVDGVERCMGHVRLSKDMQRLKNMQISKLGEISAASSYEKPILTPEQIVGHQTMWEDDNVKNYPYLLLNPITDASGQLVASGPIAYTKPPSIPPAMAALLQLTDQDMREILGNAQQGEQMVSNIAQKTVEMIQERLDMQTYIYMSNFAKAIKRVGEVWLSMASEVYSEQGRKMKGVTATGDTTEIELGVPKIGKNGEQYTENDMSEARMDVVADVGPSSSSKRQATVRTMKELMAVNQDPETATVLSSMVMMNVEGEGVGEVRDFFRQKLIRMGAIKPTEEESKVLAEELANKPEDPNATYLKSAAAEAEANATKARADTLLTLTKSDQVRADILKTLSEIDATEKDQALRALEMLLGASPSTSAQTQTVPAVQSAAPGAQPGGAPGAQPAPGAPMLGIPEA